MKYDTIIIGGGLSGLTAGIELLRSGRRVAILSKGSGRLTMNSGSIDLLGYDLQGNVVNNPLDAIDDLPDIHPYRKVKKINDVSAVADDAKRLLEQAGVVTSGEVAQNHARLTPIGKLKPTWLTMDGYVEFEHPAIAGGNLPWRRIALLNIKGFLDFPVDMLAGNLRARGVRCDVSDITIAELEHRRYSPAEMRSTNLAATLSRRGAIASLAGQINSNSNKAEAVLMPALVGLDDSKAIASLRQLVNKPVFFVATLPPSVGGNRLHTLLRKHFIKLGGTFILGSTVKSGIIEGGRVIGITAKNLPDQVITAEDYILASGSLNSGGIVASYERVYEPVFNLDVNVTTGRESWNIPSMYDFQPYMEFGVLADDCFRALQDGKAIENLYVIGSVLAGNNSVKLATEGGVSMLTALSATRVMMAK